MLPIALCICAEWKNWADLHCYVDYAKQCPGTLSAHQHKIKSLTQVP